MSDLMLDKVRKLLAKADDPAASEHEARLYTDKALRLMAEYGIDQAMLATRAEHSDPIADTIITAPAPYAADKLMLAATVASGFRCRAIQRTQYPDGIKTLSLHVFGFDSDLRLVEILYTSLLVQAMHGLARTSVPTGEHIAAFRRSWLAGFAHVIGSRLAAASDQARADADAQSVGQTSTAIVLADRQTQVDEAVADAYPRLGTARHRRRSGSGLAQGARAGTRADLGDSHGLAGDNGRGRLNPKKRLE